MSEFQEWLVGFNARLKEKIRNAPAYPPKRPQEGVVYKTWAEITTGPEADEIRRCIRRAEYNTMLREWGMKDD